MDPPKIYVDNLGHFHTDFGTIHLDEHGAIVRDPQAAQPEPRKHRGRNKFRGAKK